MVQDIPASEKTGRKLGISISKHGILFRNQPILRCSSVKSNCQVLGVTELVKSWLEGLGEMGYIVSNSAEEPG
jgi:hypothetical protein